MAIDEAYKKYVWLKGLYVELCGDNSCINLFCDSQNAIYLTKDQMLKDRSKNIQIPLCERIVAQGKMKVCKITSYDNPKDMMIKAVSVAKFDLWSSLVDITYYPKCLFGAKTAMQEGICNA
jgi:hypothetical protein